MRALVIVDVQSSFVERHFPSHNDMVAGTIRAIAKAKREKRKVVVVEFNGGGKTLPEIRERLPLDTVWVVKNQMGGGKEILRALPCLREAEFAGVYTTQCVSATAVGLAGEGVRCNINLKATADTDMRQDVKRIVGSIERTKEIFQIPLNMLTVE
jgi:nicotinamidase-related amidase